MERPCSNEETELQREDNDPTTWQSSNEESKLQRGGDIRTMRSKQTQRFGPLCREDMLQRGDIVPTRRLAPTRNQSSSEESLLQHAEGKRSWSTRRFITPPRRKDTVLPSRGVCNAARMKDGTSNYSKLHRNPISAKAQPLVETQAQRICRYIEHPFPVPQAEEHTPRAQRSTGISHQDSAPTRSRCSKRNLPPRRCSNTTPTFRSAKLQHPRPSDSLKATRHH
jgi:hypothetical protein